MMEAIKSPARFAFAIAMVAFGLQQVVYGEFVTRVVPKLPAWIPWHSFWAYVTGIGLIAAGAAIMFHRGTRKAAIVLGCFILASFLLFYLPQVLAGPALGAIWTNAGKALAFAGGAFLVAGSVAGERISRLDRLMSTGRVLLSAFLILTGIQHFLFAAFVATLVPQWIPGHLFWTYFAGVALMAGGIGMLVPLTRKIAGILTAIMILLWVVLLHIPRAIAAPRSVNETTAVFEALAISATALLVAATTSTPARQGSDKAGENVRRTHVT